MSRWSACLVLAAALALIECEPPPTAFPPGPGARTAPPRVDPPPPAAPIEDMSLADAGPESASGKAPAPGSPEPGSALVRDGGRCERAIQCASGICEGEGCGPDRPGVCMAKTRRCTRDLRQYCGCDGKTFQGSGSCPGRRFSARAECP